MVTPGCKHFNLNLLKDLKQLQLHLHGLRKTMSRKLTNSKFISNTKSVYHNFKCSSITVNETPTKNTEKNFGTLFGKK